LSDNPTLTDPSPKLVERRRVSSPPTPGASSSFVGPFRRLLVRTGLVPPPSVRLILAGATDRSVDPAGVIGGSRRVANFRDWRYSFGARIPIIR
jgi:hypothetical protein